jgi:hypothetical protein
MKYFYTKYAMATFITFDNSLGDYTYGMNTQVYLCIYGSIWWQPSTLLYILEYLSCLFNISHYTKYLDLEYSI